MQDQWDSCSQSTVHSAEQIGLDTHIDGLQVGVAHPLVNYLYPKCYIHSLLFLYDNVNFYRQSSIIIQRKIYNSLKCDCTRCRSSADILRERERERERESLLTMCHSDKQQYLLMRVLVSDSACVCERCL